LSVRESGVRRLRECQRDSRSAARRPAARAARGRRGAAIRRTARSSPDRRAPPLGRLGARPSPVLV